MNNILDIVKNLFSGIPVLDPDERGASAVLQVGPAAY